MKASAQVELHGIDSSGTLHGQQGRGTEESVVSLRYRKAGSRPGTPGRCGGALVLAQYPMVQFQGFRAKHTGAPACVPACLPVYGRESHVSAIPHVEDSGGGGEELGEPHLHAWRCEIRAMEERRERGREEGREGAEFLPITTSNGSC